MNLDKLKENISKKYLFYLISFSLFIIFLYLQFNIWLGDYSYSKLNGLNQAIKEKKQDNQLLKEKNLELEQEKNKFSSSRSAIEGLARSELGLIKPGETFYKFKIKKENNSLEDERSD